jgi:glycosyltransferase involved in cell wall biosynthesis
MVRNMEPLVAGWAGNAWLERLKNIARKREARTACHRASRVLAVSDYVRRFLVGAWNVPTDRVGVVHHGVEDPIAPANTVKPHLASALTHGRFVLTAGSIRPARGLEDLLRAWPRVRQCVPSLHLVVAGKPDPGTRGHFRKLQRLEKALIIADEVIWAGHLTETEMAWCFQNAAAFVMTSRAEACPNIVLEAMAYGALCVSTDAPPMPEVFRSAAAYYRQASPSALAESLIGVLQAGVSEKRSLRSAALRRARDFGWRQTAERTVEELSAALRASPRK